MKIKALQCHYDIYFIYKRDLTREDADQSFSMNYHTLATNEDGELQSSNAAATESKTKVEKPVPKPRNPLRRSLSAQHRAIKVRLDIKKFWTFKLNFYPQNRINILQICAYKLYSIITF